MQFDCRLKHHIEGLKYKINLNLEYSTKIIIWLKTWIKDDR